MDIPATIFERLIDDPPLFIIIFYMISLLREITLKLIELIQRTEKHIIELRDNQGSS